MIINDDVLKMEDCTTSLGHFCREDKRTLWSYPPNDPRLRQTKWSPGCRSFFWHHSEGFITGDTIVTGIAQQGTWHVDPTIGWLNYSDSLTGFPLLTNFWGDTLMAPTWSKRWRPKRVPSSALRWPLAPTHLPSGVTRIGSKKGTNGCANGW
jgi:hypothetical protein